jgi:OOP family OmpA-OmpF porin
MRITKKWIVFMGVSLTSTAWGADLTGNDSVGRWYVAPELGATITGHTRSVDNGLFYGLAFGKHLSPEWSAELNVLSGKYDGRRGAPGDRITAISADALRVFNRDSTVAPFLTAGVGVIDDDLGSGHSQSFMTQVGVGALIRAWQNPSGSTSFALRPLAKVRWDDNSSQGHPADFLVGLGFELTFGAPSAAAAVVPAAVAASLPAPAAQPEAKPAVLDSDGDGVPDDKDLCPNTPYGTAVDANGCPLKGSITLVGVRFENDSARLSWESSSILDPVAVSLREHPRLRVEVQGHTDAVGSAPYNLKLSQARAEAVRDYLVAHGVPATELTAKGYGKTEPIADNKTADGRARNRRVVMQVLENPGDVEIKQSGDTH